MRPIKALTLALLLAAGAAKAQGCALSYELRVQPSHIDVSLTLPATNGSATPVFMRTEWLDTSRSTGAMRAEGGTLEIGERPGQWLLRHSGPARIFYRVKLTSNVSTKYGSVVDIDQPQSASDHFQILGHGFLLLPVQEQDSPVETCLDWQLAEPLTDPIFNSFGLAKNGTIQRVRASVMELNRAFFAGGDGWRLQKVTLPGGGELNVAVRGSFLQVSDQEVARRTAQLAIAQRHFLRQQVDLVPPLQWLLLTPNGMGAARQATRAVMLHGKPDFSVESSQLVNLMTLGFLSDLFTTRIQARELSGLTKPTDVWLHSGFTFLYAERMKLAGGFISLDDYAREMTTALNQYLESKGRTWPGARVVSGSTAPEQQYLRGAWLALRWEDSLSQRAGAPTLSSLVRGLLLPADHNESTPAAGRLLAALRPYLSTRADEDVQRVVYEGRALAPEDIPPGPCLRLEQAVIRSFSLGFDRGSIALGVAQGVDPEGPAYAAGLRNGMRFRHSSLTAGNPKSEVYLAVTAADGTPREIRYLPVSIKALERPSWRPLANAARDVACQRWMRLD